MDKILQKYKKIILIFQLIILFFQKNAFSTENYSIIEEHNQKFKTKNLYINYLKNQSVISIFGKGSLNQNNYIHNFSDIPFNFNWTNGVFETENLDSLQISNTIFGSIFILPSTNFVLQNSENDTKSIQAKLNSGKIRCKAFQSNFNKLLKNYNDMDKIILYTNEAQIIVPFKTDFALERKKEGTLYYTSISLFNGEITIFQKNYKVSNSNFFINKQIKLKPGTEIKIYEDGKTELYNNIKSSTVEYYTAWTITPIDQDNQISYQPLPTDIYEDKNNKLKQEKIITSQKNNNLIDIIFNSGYSILSLFGETYTGYNFNINPLISVYKFSKKYQFILGIDSTYEYVKNNNSSTNLVLGNYTTSSEFTAISVGINGGIKFNVFPKFSAYALASIHYAPSTTFHTSIHSNTTTIEFSPKVNTNWNSGINLKIFYNIIEQLGVGTSFYIGEGYIDYSGSQYNQYKLSSGQGYYNIYNLDVSISYYL